MTRTPNSFKLITMKFTIVIVTANRPKELFTCLNSVFSQKHSYKFETIVIFNGDLAYHERCNQLFKQVKTYFIHKTTPAMARNYAVSKSSGDYIFFLDDDCELPKNYFQLIDFNLDWDVMGGPDKTPTFSSRFQLISGRALTSPLCMGPTRFRHQADKSQVEIANEATLILCNLWIKSSIFKNENFCFNTHLFRNEENFLLKELSLAGKKIYRNSTLFVFHIRKKTFESLGFSVFKSAFYRVQNFSILPLKSELIYFTPIIWLLSLLWAFFHPEGILIKLFFSYTGIIFIHHLIKYRSVSFLYVLFHYFILFMYSIGLIKGLFSFTPLLYRSLRLNKSLIKESKSK